MTPGGVARVAADALRRSAGGTRHALRRRVAPATSMRNNPFRVVWIATETIDRLTVERLPESVRGRRLDGDWDRTALPLEGLVLFAGLRQRFVDGADWGDTILHPARYPGDAPAAGSRFDDQDEATFWERARRIDALYAALERDGWLPHRAIGAPFHRELAVVIGRDGRPIRNSGGLHRLILSRWCGVTHAPVRILTEHAEYVAR